MLLSCVGEEASNQQHGKWRTFFKKVSLSAATSSVPDVFQPQPLAWTSVWDTWNNKPYDYVLQAEQ